MEQCQSEQCDVERLKLDYENIPLRVSPSDCKSWIMNLRPSRKILVAKHIPTLSGEREQIVMYAYTERWR